MTRDSRRSRRPDGRHVAGHCCAYRQRMEAGSSRSLDEQAKRHHSSLRGQKWPLRRVWFAIILSDILNKARKEPVEQECNWRNKALWESCEWGSGAQTERIICPQ